MRCNQVTIKIERFGKYVPKNYPDKVQRIGVYCDDYHSIYKALFKAKAKMLTPDEVVEFIGHEIGGVCPFGINEGVNVYLDESLKRFTTVFPACGSSNSAIELTIPELEKYSNFTQWVDVCKG